MKKKIAIIYSGSRNGGGVDTYLTSLLASKNPEVDLTLFSLGEWELTKKLQITNYKLQIFSGARFNPITVFRIAQVLKKESFNLVVTGGVVSSAYGRAAAVFAGLPVLTIVHSDQTLDYPNPVARFIYALIERITRWKTARYITVSKYLANRLKRSGISDEKITVIYNGVAINTKLKTQNTKGDGHIVIGSIGRLHPVKNYGALILAMKELKTKNFKLKIAGEGDERPKLEALIIQNNLGNKVELSGHVESIEEFLAGIDIYVQPSLSEGFGLTVVEAMLAGLPVIVTPVGSLPEIVKDKETGIVLEGTTPEDIAKGIEKLMKDKILRTKIAQNGQKYAKENFGVREWARQTINTLLEVTK